MRSRWNHLKSNNNNNTTPDNNNTAATTTTEAATTATTTSTKEPAEATPYDEADDDGVSKTPLIPKYVYHVNITIIFLLLLLLIYLAIVIFQIVFSCYIDCINAAMIDDTAAAAVRNNNNYNHELNNIYCPHNA